MCNAVDGYFGDDDDDDDVDDDGSVDLVRDADQEKDPL